MHSDERDPLSNRDLQDALWSGTREFTRDEWRAFGIDSLDVGDHVQVGRRYFRPIDTHPIGRKLTNAELSRALQNGTLEFTDETLRTLGVARDLKGNRFVVTDDGRRFQTDAPSDLASMFKHAVDHIMRVATRALKQRRRVPEPEWDSFFKDMRIRSIIHANEGIAPEDTTYEDMFSRIVLNVRHDYRYELDQWKDAYKSLNWVEMDNKREWRVKCRKHLIPPKVSFPHRSRQDIPDPTLDVFHIKLEQMDFVSRFVLALQIWIRVSSVTPDDIANWIVHHFYPDEEHMPEDAFDLAPGAIFLHGIKFEITFRTENGAPHIVAHLDKYELDERGEDNPMYDYDRHYDYHMESYGTDKLDFAQSLVFEVMKSDAVGVDTIVFCARAAAATGSYHGDPEDFVTRLLNRTPEYILPHVPYVRWARINGAPASGTPLNNQKLSAALRRGMLDFTRDEWEEVFGWQSLRADHFVAVDDEYFRPANVERQEEQE